MWKGHILNNESGNLDSVCRSQQNCVQIPPMKPDIVVSVVSPLRRPVIIAGNYPLKSCLKYGFYPHEKRHSQGLGFYNTLFATSHWMW